MLDFGEEVPVVGIELEGAEWQGKSNILLVKQTFLKKN